VSEQVSFLVTKELGKLAKWLRIIGFDAKYTPASEKNQIVVCSLRENRIILTRNKSIGARQGIRVVHIGYDDLMRQLRQVLDELRLKPDSNLFFMRCVLCNEPLREVKKETVKAEVPEYVFNTQEEFVRCDRCNRVYWKGTHWGNVQRCLKEIQGNA